MSRIRRLIPGQWAYRRPLLARLADALGGPFDLWFSTVLNARGELLEPSAVAEDRLDYLLRLVGVVFEVSIPVDVKRRLAEIAFDVWPINGTISGMTIWLQAIAGDSASISNPPEGESFIAGVNLAGDTCGPGALGYTLVLNVPAVSGFTEAEIRALMTPVVPGFMSYTINWI